ncbi:MAG: MarR family transcriptional regulator [Solirubrobacteraceae bacterium]|nr:MarR family transcriptional regulator [Solirubrobacteraceae bacterium]
MATFARHERLSDYTGFLLRKVSTASFEQFAAIAAEHGIHPMHFGMLVVLESEGDISQRELARRTGVDPSTLVGRLDVLEERGLVERKRCEHDRRSNLLRLTDAGRETLDAMRVEAEELRRRFFAPLTEEEQAELHRLLLKLANAIESEGAAS